MNLMKMMQQAQGIQKKLKEAQAELADLEIIGQSAGGAVTVTLDGRGKFKSIKINQEAAPNVDMDTIETLEDIISTALKQADEEAGRIMEEKIKGATGGIPLPGLTF
jgi:DNA-binding YbaB/EbfC family protein